MRACWLVALGVAGCFGGKTPAPTLVKATEPPKPPPPACVRPPDVTAPISHASGTLRAVSYCVGSGNDQCFALDLVSGQLTHLEGPPPGISPQDGVHVETTSPALKVCTGSTCKALTPQVWPGAAPLHAATNGTYAVVLLGDAQHGRGYAEVWDVAKAKRLTTIRYAHGDYKCGDVAMLGDTIFIAASTCSSPSARAALYAVNGRKIANVGPRDFGTYGSAFVQVEGTTWAFLGENGAHVALQDVAKGKVLKTIDLGDLWRRDKDGKDDAFGNPGESVVISLAPAKLGVIAGTPQNGSVAIVDVNSGEVQVVHAPLCQSH
ncbi:MAG: hypothetical protein ACM31C_08470 [Acidobacteriota bacterium]